MTTSTISFFDRNTRGSVDQLLQGFFNKPEPLPDHHAKIISAPHDPKTFLITCIDSRLQPAAILNYDPGLVLESRPIAAVVPPVEHASDEFMSRMEFRRLKGIKSMLLLTHSDCGGAQTAVAHPDPDLVTDKPLQSVARCAHRSGLNIGRLTREFMDNCGHDHSKASDEMSRALGVQSLRNLMTYPGIAPFDTIEDEIMRGGLDVVLLNYNMKEHSFDHYNVRDGKWEKLEDAVPHFCGKANDCHGCSCTWRIDQNPVEASFRPQMALSA